LPKQQNSNQITVDVTSMHAKASFIGTVLNNVSRFLKRIASSAEQWTSRAYGSTRLAESN
jgi:hypothetical protein